jgi:hypothetical protein
MDRIPKRTRAEQETCFRFDEEEHVLWASTTTPRVATRWRRAGYALRVVSAYADGTPATWEVRLPWLRRRDPWLRILRLGLSNWTPSVRRPDTLACQNGGAPARGKASGRVLPAEAPEGVGA